MPVVIHPDGMYGGDRMAALSDLARLHWPWLYLASNGYGRLECNYLKILGRVYAHFSDPISKETFMNLLREYHQRHLLFTYSYNGQLWGQWDTSAKYLPRYKSALDDASPAPPYEAWDAWRKAYAAARSRGSTTIGEPEARPLDRLFSALLRKPSGGRTKRITLITGPGE